MHRDPAALRHQARPSRRLLAQRPRGRPGMSDAAALLSVRDLRVHYAARGTDRAVVKAVDGISFDVPAGRTVALVGESGWGKSTTPPAILGLEPLTSGSVRFEGRDITQLDRAGR